MASQELLFSEPSIAETGVWCQLNEEIDPAEWAELCRLIGQLGEKEFLELKRRLLGGSKPVYNRKIGEQGENAAGGKPGRLGAILVSLGPSGIQGEYQREGIL